MNALLAGSRGLAWQVALVAGFLLLSTCSSGGGKGADAATGDQAVESGPSEAEIIDPGPTEKRVVLLITGSSIVAAFFDLMSERLKAEGFEPVVFQPDDLFTDTLALGAERIGEAVKKTLAETGVKKLDVIAECNGGVAARYYLDQLAGDANIDRFITFVSAHHGTEWAKPGLNAALQDITPGSPFLAKLNSKEGAPIASSRISIYICTDEIMVPYTTSKIGGALNIEVCDPDFDKRAKERTPYDVKDTMGDFLIKSFPIHLAGFWDEPFFDLLVSCLEDNEETVKKFAGLNLKFQ